MEARLAEIKELQAQLYQEYLELMEEKYEFDSASPSPYWSEVGKRGRMEFLGKRSNLWETKRRMEFLG